MTRSPRSPYGAIACYMRWRMRWAQLASGSQLFQAVDVENAEAMAVINGPANHPLGNEARHGPRRVRLINSYGLTGLTLGSTSHTPVDAPGATGEFATHSYR
jgi:hypothetical protein